MANANDWQRHLALPILVVGLGSMGKRRIRNLQALGAGELHGFDPRADRREETNRTYGVTVHKDWSTALELAQPRLLIISVPPQVHHVYMREAIRLGVPFFVEASVTDEGLEEIASAARARGVFGAPSATLCFHPAIGIMFDQVRNGRLGTISNVTYHMGNYLPDWHPYESVSEFYVSRKETGGAREIVPFELTWLTMLFGFPQQVTALYRKTIDIPGAPDIDDTYDLLLDHGTCSVVLVIDVVARHATRRLLINGSERQLEWNWDDQCVRVYHHDRQAWETIGYESMPAAAGYNKNITEGMYIDELRAFLRGIDDATAYPNTLERDHRVLKVLYTAERAWQERRWLTV